MKILAIGNSFSMNTTEYFNTIANLLNIDASVTNLYVPGCSLETHITNYKSNTLYELQIDAITIAERDLKSVLTTNTYDIITLQQASDFSGIISSLEPYLKDLLKIVRSYQRGAKIYYHQTWSYDQDSCHPAFTNYDYDTQKMDQSIYNVSDYVIKTYQLPIIKCGTSLMYWRSKSHDDSITKDGYHLQDGAPKILASCVWIHTLVKHLNHNNLKIIVNHFNLPQSFTNTFKDILKSLED